MSSSTSTNGTLDAQTTTLNPTPQTPQPASGTKAGAIAGAAVGCLVAGLFLGFAIATLLFRRKRKAYDRNEARTKSSSSPVPPSPRADAGFQLSKFLLDSSPDAELASELRSLDNLIQQHVENNYHLGPVQADPRDLAAALAQLGIGSVNNGQGPSPEVVAQLALEPDTRNAALRHVISRVLFTSVDVSAQSHLSMLPGPVAAFLRSIPPAEAEERDAKVASLALDRWRALSAFLLHPTRSQRTPLVPSSAAMDAQAAALGDALDAFLGHFAEDNKESRAQQQRHLQSVIAETTKFGYLLFSQPGEWRLVHDHVPGPDSRPIALDVCAGLVKVRDKHGTPYTPPRQVIAPATVVV